MAIIGLSPSPSSFPPSWKRPQASLATISLAGAGQGPPPERKRHQIGSVRNRRRHATRRTSSSPSSTTRPGRPPAGSARSSSTGLAAQATTLRASTDDKLAKETIHSAAVEKEKDDYDAMAVNFRNFYRAV